MAERPEKETHPTCHCFVAFSNSHTKLRLLPRGPHSYHIFIFILFIFALSPPKLFLFPYFPYFPGVSLQK